MTSASKSSRDVVPINITCNKVISNGGKDDGVEAFKILWKKALHVAESAKNYPPNMIKYQHNFNVLIQEILRSTPHLFTDEEKIFMGIKYSARLYCFFCFIFRKTIT